MHKIKPKEEVIHLVMIKDKPFQDKLISKTQDQASMKGFITTIVDYPFQCDRNMKILSKDIKMYRIAEIASRTRTVQQHSFA